MDDYSMSYKNNHTSQSLTSRTDNNSSEESGWTLYFEDFINNNYGDIKIDDEEQNACSFPCSGYQNSSIISDSASRKVIGKSSKLVSKNRKVTAKKVIDEDLEDTASSPCHSPKVNDLNHPYMKSKGLCSTQDVCQVNYYKSLQIEHTNKYCMDFPQEKLGQTPEHAAGEGIKLGYLETQLRKKGLCLVPMSMLINNLT